MLYSFYLTYTYVNGSGIESKPAPWSELVTLDLDQRARFLIAQPPSGFGIVAIKPYAYQITNGEPTGPYWYGVTITNLTAPIVFELLAAGSGGEGPG